MIIIYFCLEELFNYAFESAYFDEVVFNPEIINILFDNNKTLKFHIKEATLSPINKIFENSLKFCLNYLSISQFLTIHLKFSDISEQHTNILFNILINRANKLPKINFSNSKLTKLYDLFIQVNRVPV